MSEPQEPGESRDVVARMRALGLRTDPDALSAWLRDAHRQRLGPTETVEQLIAMERRTREANNLAQRTRLAMIGTPKPLDRFDRQHPRAIDRARYESLLSMDFLRAGENVQLRGPSGVGKTTLAQHLALGALAAGKTVRFGTLSTAMADLLKQESVPATERRFKRYLLPDLLVLEIGYLPCETRAADRKHPVRTIFRDRAGVPSFAA